MCHNTEQHNVLYNDDDKQTKQNIKVVVVARVFFQNEISHVHILSRTMKKR